jgi:hypothetical protein
VPDGERSELTGKHFLLGITSIRLNACPEEHLMPNPPEALRDRLSRYRQVKISVIGRKSGKTITCPVWFVLDGDTLYLLPVRGSDTQWYRNVLKNRSIQIDARGAGAELRGKPITDKATVKFVVEKFRDKYDAANVKKYYSKFDVAVGARLA